MSPSPRKSAFEYAVNALTRRGHSVAELRKKMKEKLYEAQEIESVLHLLISKGFLNDASYAESLCSILSARGDGKRKIAGKLRMKGIDPELIKETLSSLEEQIPEEEAALASLQKKSSALLREEDPCKRKEKALRFLAGRGFGLQACFRAFELWCHSQKNET